MTATFKLYRSNESTRVASSTVIEVGSMLITDEGNIYLGNGVAAASALAPLSGGGGSGTSIVDNGNGTWTAISGVTDNGDGTWTA